MPAVFINYRTGDGEDVAVTLDTYLSNRFGTNLIYRASKSIEPGQRYPIHLITNVRRSSVLLAVIGSRWLTARAENGRSPLFDPEDWVRTEILEAFAHKVTVIPVLVGRTTRLNPADLPDELVDLVEHQTVKYESTSADVDLATIAERLMRQIPELADRTAVDDSPGHQATGQRGGITNFGDNSGTIMNEPTGVFHTGSGSMYNALPPDFDLFRRRT
ncbi:hypothetical protein Acor_33200 [Acrocarpospora corrugata]|uniref:TIR domain-containing protein n=1 Tax=Acrocarpospora corrugata TaxID=35763 RepID=A0A5M3VXL2_9ACTN|nr:TIR domain-containing protein [Acrocarpospora corrugata]GES01256.1 hypothetical protein Acor_33200 [Acrocarpospora corrugata]